MFRSLSITILTALAMWPSHVAADAYVSGDVLSTRRMSLQNAPDQVVSEGLSFINGEGLKFQFFLRVLPHTLGTAGTVFAIEFETEAGDIRSITFDGVGGEESTGNITSFAGGTSNSLGSYPKGIMTVYEVVLGRDHWTILGGGEILLEQDYPFNNDRFTLRYRLGNPTAHPGDGTGIVALDAQGVHVDDWLTIADPGAPPIADPLPSNDGNPVIVVSEGADVPRGVFTLNRYQLGSPKADALIGKLSHRMRGDDVYNRTGKGQTVLFRKRPRGKVVFWVKAQNDGSFVERLRISASTKTPGLKVAYGIPGQSKTRNVTAGVKLARLTTGALNPGESENLRVMAQSRKRRSGQRNRRESKGTILIRVESTREPVSVDVVRAIIKPPKRVKDQLPAWFPYR